MISRFSGFFPREITSLESVVSKPQHHERSHPVWKRRKDSHNILEELEGDQLARAGFVGGEGKLGRSLGWEGLSRFGSLRWEDLNYEQPLSLG